MDFGSLLLLLALVIIVATFVASPFKQAQMREAVSKEDIELSELLAERERVLDAIAELDFDQEMGKVPEELYGIQREALMKRGADVLRLLDARTDAEEKMDEEHTARLERAARLRAQGDDPIEAIIAARRVKKAPAPVKAEPAAAGKAKFCPNCGDALQPGDRFCSSCGQKI